MDEAREQMETRLIAALCWILLLGSATIAAAWFFELVLGYQPCKLCLEQRIPYYIGLPVTAIALALSKLGLARLGLARPALSLNLLRLVLLLLALVFLIGSALGAYHAGVEWALWPGPADCGGKSQIGPKNAVDLLGALKATQVIQCSQAAWRLFGISMAGWNALISALLVLTALSAALRRKA